MNKLTLTSALIALSLTACGKSDEAAPAASQSPAATVAKADAAPAASGALAFSKEFMTGKWADKKDGDCALAQNFKADGSVEGAFQRWEAGDNSFTAEMAGQRMVFPVRVIDRKTIEVTSPQGKVSQLVSC